MTNPTRYYVATRVFSGQSLVSFSHITTRADDLDHFWQSIRDRYPDHYVDHISEGDGDYVAIYRHRQSTVTVTVSPDN